MNDRKLLELAAKAAGIEDYDFMLDGSIYYRVKFEIWGKTWNPLTDDGDALRLAVKLSLTVDATSKTVAVVVTDQYYSVSALERINDDPYAATRRAIVRAAAEIGRTM